MSRSIHTTRRDLDEMHRWNYSDSDAKAESVEALKEEIGVKRRAKRQVSGERSMPACPMPSTDIESISVVVRDQDHYVHYPASPEDIRNVMKLLPRGVLDGLSEVELSPGSDYRTKSNDIYDDEEDPYTGRVGCQVLPGVYSARCQGNYSRDTARIRLFAYVYDSMMPDREMWECYLRLDMLSTFVHEVAHHNDNMTRVARGRWRMDDEAKVEMYAEGEQHNWTQDIVIPYLEREYPAQVKSLLTWIEHHGGFAVPLQMLADDPRTTLGNGVINASLALFSVSSAVGQLAQAVNEGRSLTETHLEFAWEMHYGENYDPALQIIERVLADEPGNLEAMTLQADIYEHQEKYAEARELAESVVRLDEMNEDAWRVLASVYEETCEWPPLINAVTRLLETFEQPPACHATMLLSRARALLEIGDNARANADIEAVDRIVWNTSRGAPFWVRKKRDELEIMLREKAQ